MQQECATSNSPPINFAPKFNINPYNMISRRMITETTIAGKFVIDRFIMTPLKNWMVFVFLLNRYCNDDFYFW